MKLALDERVCLNLFAGPGGMEVGIRAAGWHSTDFVEYDKHACATLRNNFDGTVHECDIRTLRVRDYTQRYYPLHLYTFPCDHYSQFSNVWGAQTGDDLYLHCLRNNALLFAELILIENVLGMREKFPVVMELWRNLPQYHTTEIIAWGEDYSLMRKARVFLILHRQPFTFPSLDHFSAHHDIPLPVILARPGRTLGEYLDGPSIPGPAMQPYIEKRLEGGYRDLPKCYDPEQEDPICLPTNYKRDRGVALVADKRYDCGYRPFSVRELARLHGFPDSHTFCGPMGSQYGQVVDSVMPTVAYALGALVNAYFEAIDDLLPQPKSLGYRYVSTSRNKQMAPSDHLLHGPLQKVPLPSSVVAPIPTDLTFPPLFSPAQEQSHLDVSEAGSHAERQKL